MSAQSKSIQLQFLSENIYIQEAKDRFKSVVSGDDYKGVTSTQLNNTIDLFNKVDSIVDVLLAPVTKKQGLREVTSRPIDTFNMRQNKKILAYCGAVEFLTKNPDKPSDVKQFSPDKEFRARWNTLIHITLSAMFDGAFAPQMDGDVHPLLPDASQFSKITQRIGDEVEMFYRMSVLRESNRDSFNKVFYNDLTDQVLPKEVHIKMAKKSLKDLDAKWVEWSVENRVRIGCSLAMLVLSSTKDQPVFELKVERIADKTFSYLLPSADLVAQVESATDSISQNLMIRKPMVTRPRSWSKDISGGYLTNFSIQRDSIIRGVRLGDKSKPSQMAYDFINNLQSVSYQVNPFILMVANILQGQGISVGKFQPKSALKSVNPWSIRSTLRTRDTLAIANEFSKTDFFIPWSFDFRGRVYPLVSFLSPQGTDFDKGLLRLAQGKQLTDSGVAWLKIHIATTCGADGIDKESLQTRQDWVDNNIDLIKAVASDPIGNLDRWSDVEEPFSFLAACKEYVDCVINGKDSHLFVASDATCSGIQILSGLSLDRKAAKLVNVVPSETRQDAYLAVADAASALLKTQGRNDLAKLVTRGVCKKVVMTVPYNASARTNFEQVGSEFKKNKIKVDKLDVTAIGQSIIEGMKETVPGPTELRDRFNDAVKDLVQKDEPTTISWVTPSGFKVVQESIQFRTIKLKATLIGRQELQISVGPDLDKDGKPIVAKGKHKTAFMPNLIHSLDASLLAMSFHSVDYGFSVIHDSVLTHANDMSQAIDGLKDAYTKCFSNREFLTNLEKTVLKCEPLCSEKPSFDASEVKQSEFFFS